MKILITGGSGFIGKNLIATLHKKYNITALLRPQSDGTLIKQYCQIYYYSNIEELIALFKNQTFDGIIHLATFYQPNNDFKDLKNILESNIFFGTQILESIKINPPKFFINALTFSQFANKTQYQPASLYDASKQAFFDIISFYQQSLPTKFAHLLLYNTYGKNDTRPKIFNLWQKNARTQTPLEMSAGEQKIDISHIDDVIIGFDTILQNITNKKDFNPSIIYTLENFPRYSLRELASIFEAATNTKLNILWGAKAYRQNEILDPISSLLDKKFQKLPNWQPKINIETGIKDIFG